MYPNGDASEEWSIEQNCHFADAAGCNFTNVKEAEHAVGVYEKATAVATGKLSVAPMKEMTPHENK